MDPRKLEEALQVFGDVVAAGQARGGARTTRSPAAQKRASKQATAGDDERDARRLVAEALQRLKADPALLSGDPAGVYTYEDPVLALSAEYAKLWETGAVRAAGDGSELNDGSLLRWLLVGARAALSHAKRAEGVLMSRVPSAPHVIREEIVRLALLGDAGYAGQAQENVLGMIRRRHAEAPFHVLVHLGDTYFGGSVKEVTTNLLTPLRSLPFDAFTLCGNHDLYYGPEGYDAALTILRQPGRFFAIETPRWVVACLDTAVASAKLMRNDGKLDPAQRKWLDELLIDAEKKGKPVVLMSHHFIVSDWEKPAESLQKQVRQLAKDRRFFAWYWGHEHRSATYDAAQHDFHGACIGHGAFLERITEPRASPTASWRAEGRCNCYRSDGPAFHPHGYVELELRADGIVERHHLEDGQVHERSLTAPSKRRAKRRSSSGV